MSTNPLNDISKIYLDQIAEKKKDDTYLEPDMKKRQANNEKARKELAKGPQMKNPHFEETQMEGVRDTDPEKGTKERKARLEKKRGMKLDDHPQYAKEALDPVGKEDGDIDNDGDKDSSDEYLMKRRKAIGKAMKKRLKEERESLSEVMDDTEASKEVKEKKVNNKVVINPKLGEAVEEMGGTLIEQIEIDEMDYVIESVYDELIEEGFSEDDVEFGIESALNTLDEGYYDSAVKASKDAAAKIKGEAPKKSLKDRVKSAAKKAIFGAGRAAGQAAKAKAAVQAAPQKAKSAMQAKIDKVKRIAKAGYKSGRGPVEKKSTTYRGAGAGRKEKVTEAVYGGEPEKKKDTRMTVTAADKKANTPAYQKFKAGDKRYKAADHMGEGYKGKHGQSDKEYADSRSQGGKMISGDSKRSGAEYTHGRRVKAANPGMQPDVGGKTKPKSQGKMDSGTRADLQYRKANLKKEETEVSEGVYGADSSMRKAAAKERAAEKKAGSKAKSPGRLGPSAGKSYADHEAHSIKAHDKITKKTKPSVLGMTSEEASMSPQELMLQKKKARIDKMIAMKRAQGLSKMKAGAEQPAKAMGEETEDSLRDRRMERGGVDGNVRYDMPSKSSSKFAPGPKKKSSGSDKAIDFVRREITAKYGKGALIDTKKK